MMHQGVTFFYRLFDFFDLEKIAKRNNNDNDMKYDNINPNPFNATQMSNMGMGNNPFGKNNNNTSNDDDNLGIPLFEDFSPNCAVSGAGLLCFGDNNGLIKFINRDMQIFKFKSHSERIQKLFKTPNSDILIALGKHVEIPDGPVETFIHIWRLSDLDALGNPRKIKSFRLFPDQNTPELPISSLTATSSGSQIAVGCANGVVLVFNINLRARSYNIAISSTNSVLDRIKAIKLTKEGPHAVTGLHYLENYNNTPGKTILYVITVHAIMSFHLYNKNYPCLIFDKSGGCDLNCSTVNDLNGGELIVAKSETIHIFVGEEIRGEHAFPGKKEMLCSFRRYLIVVTSIKTKMTQAKRVEVCIYDNNNKYVAFQQQFDDLISIISEWGSVFILTNNYLIKLRDKDLQEKLNEFFRNNLYEKAIQLARSENCSPEKIIEYYCKYGDYLYDKHDYNQSMEQYLQTIDKHSTIEPSYVIRRFLDAQKIQNLTEYLARLHKYGTPTSDHTTLLLNCYTKLKDSSKLNEFININDNDDDDDDDDKDDNNKQVAKYNFDIDTAIRVCREAGLLTHARSLAKQHHKHQIYLDILLLEAASSQMNIRKYTSALKYISGLSFAEAESSILRIGSTLIENEPAGTTNLIYKLCTNWNGSGNSSSPSEYIHLFVRQSSSLLNFLEYLCDNNGDNCTSIVYNTLLEIYMRCAFELKSKYLMNDKYLTNNEYIGVTKSIDRILRTESDKYDALHALALGKMYGIESAVIYLYELLHLYHEIISHYRDRGDNDKIIETCRRFSSQTELKNSLWISAFTYFISRTSDKLDIKSIKLCLNEISRLNLIPPLMVCELLSQSQQSQSTQTDINSGINLSIIREYILNNLTHQNNDIEQDELSISELTEQIELMKFKIRNLTNSPKTFQATKCSYCTAPLELPTIHFLCGHSLHEKCLYLKDKLNPKCPSCISEYNQIYNKQEMMQRSKGDHDSFFSQLTAANSNGDAFNTIAQYFGRGVIY